jgi:homoserine kinase type II
MAVYTTLSAARLAALIAEYNVGELVSAKGIAEGVSNSNWLIETSEARFILTMYEARVDAADLPFFLGLLDHLAAKGSPVPRTIHDRTGAAFRFVEGKAVALIEFLPGVSVDEPSPAQARAVDAGLPALVERELLHLTANWPQGLPRSVIHADLFPDNVLLLGDAVTGLIDFYFACNDVTAYDLAVTHSAWCFAKDGSFKPAIAEALVAGYVARRPLSAAEWEALPVLARGAAMRFLATRAYDWLHTPADALVTRKDPMDFARRLSFYATHGAEAFPR